MPEIPVRSGLVDREALLVRGRDAVTYLHSQLSNDIAALGVGASVPSLVLEPTGKIVALVRVTRLDEERVLIDFDPGLVETLTARLLRFRIRVDVSIEPMVIGCVAVRSNEPMAAPLADTSSEVVVPAWWCDGRAWDVLALGGEIDPTRFGTPVARAVIERERIEATWPRGGHEIVAGETLPAATGVVRIAVNFAKGCYPGQELVERMDSRGATAPRQLRCIEVPEGSLVGDTVRIDDDETTITSVADDMALAYVKRPPVA